MRIEIDPKLWWWLFAEWFRRKFFRKLTLIVSDNEQFYYVRDFARPKDSWLEIEAHEGPLPEEEKQQSDNWLTPNCVEIKHNDGRIWWRKVLPFGMWSVKTYRHLTRKVDRNDDLVLDWRSLHQR